MDENTCNERHRILIADREKFCDERHRQFEKRYDGVLGDAKEDRRIIKVELASLNTKLSNHLTHIENDIISLLQPRDGVFIPADFAKKNKLLIGALVLVILFVLIPEADRSAALNGIAQLFGRVF